jgi:hypothetical protein
LARVDSSPMPTLRMAVSSMASGTFALIRVRVGDIGRFLSTRPEEGIHAAGAMCVHMHL